MWLLLTENEDPTGTWLASGIRQYTAHPVMLVTARDLTTAVHQERGVEPQGAWFRVVLADGREIDSKRLLGAINRLGPVVHHHAPRGSGRHGDGAPGHGPPLMRWLHRWDGTVLNRPNAAGRSGEHRSVFWWVDNAVHAGFAMPRGADQAPGADDAAAPVSAIVIGQELFPKLESDRPIPASLAVRCARLAQRTSASILGVDASSTAIGGWRFKTATLRPDLSGGGDGMLRMIARALGIVVARHRAAVPQDVEPT